MWARSTTLISDFGKVDILFDLKLSCASFWQLWQSLGLHFDRPEAQFWVRLGSLWRDDLGGFPDLGRVDIAALL